MYNERSSFLKGFACIDFIDHLQSYFMSTFLIFGVSVMNKFLYQFSLFRIISFTDYSNWLTIGFLLGFGALFGDSVKSFFKRRLSIKPGRPFIPLDQLDYSIGSLLFVSIIFIPSWQAILTIIIANFILHIIANHLAYYLKLSDVKW